MAGSKVGPRTTARRTTASRSAVASARTAQMILRWLQYHLIATERGHVEQCSRCADRQAAFVASVRTHAQAVEQITSTSQKAASKQSADSSEAARSHFASPGSKRHR